MLAPRIHRYCQQICFFVHCCAEREQYKISIEAVPAHESYDIGTQVTLRCIVPPSLLNSTFITIDWKTTVPNLLPYVPLRYGVDRSNVSFVIPAHHPISANYYCSVQGVEYPNTEVVRERITLKIKGAIREIMFYYIMMNRQNCFFLHVYAKHV